MDIEVKDAKFLFFDHDGTLVDTNRFYSSRKISKDVLNPETVGIIAQTSCPYAIVAGTHKKSVERTISLLPRKPSFAVCLEDYYPKIKPDPAPYLLALDRLKELGVGKNEVVVFEDSDEGSESAKRAGFRVVRIKSYCNTGGMEQC